MFATASAREHSGNLTIAVSPQPAGVRRQAKPELLVRIVGVSQYADRSLETWAGRLAGTTANYEVLHVKQDVGALRDIAPVDSICYAGGSVITFGGSLPLIRLMAKASASGRI